MAEKLIRYILNKPNASVIDNLIFLTQHHIDKTNVNFSKSQYLQHPQSNALNNLKALALYAKNFIIKYPDLQNIPNSEPTSSGNSREDSTKV